MSKYILAGEPVASFFKRGGLGCWVVKTNKDSEKLQRQVSSKASKLGYKYECKTLICIDQEKHCVPSVKYTVMCYLDND